MDCSLKCCCGSATFPTTCWQRGMWLACMQTIHCRIYVRYDTWFTSQIRVPLLHILFTFCSFTLAAQSTRHSICWPCIAAHTCIILHWSKYEACDTWLTSQIRVQLLHISFLTRVAQLSRPIIYSCWPCIATHTHVQYYSKTNLRLDTCTNTNPTVLHSIFFALAAQSIDPSFIPVGHTS